MGLRLKGLLSKGMLVVVRKMVTPFGGVGWQAMVAGDPSARWIMQAWLFFNEGFFWKAPQIQVPPTYTGACYLYPLLLQDSRGLAQQ